jgi:N-acetylglucosaminyldiphosphoundecaprenol N-acetyl-beta-D-mannosaminyltransferase
MRTDAAACRAQLSRNVHCLLGLPIDAVGLEDAEEKIRRAADNRAQCFLSTPNVNFLVASRSDPAFRNAILQSDLSVADGMPLVWLARLMGIPIRERVAGSSLFDALRRPRGRPLSVYFFGGPQGVAAAAQRRFAAARGGLACVGSTFPGFGSVAEMSGEKTIEEINASKADLLVVSLGSRKGQAWIAHNRARLNVPVISHLGAVLHFAAGTLRRAPVWMQNAGLEWLWRIREEPGLWRRYFQDALALLVLLATRAVPYAWYQRRHGPRAAEASAAGIRTSRQGCNYIIRLRGSWTQANIARLRRCLYHAVLGGKDVTLDMQAVTHVDAAFIGLLMLAEAHQARNGRNLKLAAPTKRVRRVIDGCCAEYLYSAADAAAPASAMVLDADISREQAG